MSMDGFAFKKKDIIWPAAVLLLLLYLFLPRSGESVIAYSISKAALVDVACLMCQSATRFLIPRRTIFKTR